MADHATRVLVVEDYEDTRQLYQVFLEGNGFSVEVAVDGADGLAQALARPPAVIVLDIGLPKLNGFEVARRLRSDPRTVKVPIIAVSAQQLLGYEELAENAGCNEALTKPCMPEDLLAAVNRALRRA